MTRTKSTYLALLAVLLSPMAANADPIVNTGLCEDGINTCYASIENLLIGGNLYDVNWYTDRVLLADLLISDPGVAAFAGDPVLSLAAANAVNEAFNDAGLNLWILEFEGGGNVALWILSALNETTFDIYAAFSNADLVNGPLVGYSLDVIDDAGPFAIFTAVQVPEPSSLALLGIGLFGMALTRRRKV